MYCLNHFLLFPGTVSTDVSMAIVSPFNAVFFPSLFILCCHPKRSFFLSIPPPRPRWQIAAIHPVRNPLLPSSLPLQLWHICFHIHFMIFPKALPCSQHRWSPCKNSSSYRNLITICALIRSHRRQQENLDFQRNPNLISTIFSAFKLPPNDTNKLSCTDMAKNRSTTPDASFLVQWGWFRKWKSGWKKVLEKSVVMCSVGHSEHQESQRKASPGLQVRTRFHILSDPNSVSTKLNESA